MQHPSPHGVRIASRSFFATYSAIFWLWAAGACGSAAAPDVAPAGPQQTVGEAFFEAWCQGVVHAHDPLEVTGAKSRLMCIGREAVPATAPPDLRALVQQRARVVAAVDESVRGPGGEALRQWLDSLGPLADNGTLMQLLEAGATALRALWAHDAQSVARLWAWGEAGHLHGLCAALVADARAPEAAAQWGHLLAAEPGAVATLAHGLQEGLLAYAPEIAAWMRHSVQHPSDPVAMPLQLEAWGAAAAWAMPYLADAGPKDPAQRAALMRSFWAWLDGVQPGLARALERLARSLATDPSPWLAGRAALQVAHQEGLARGNSGGEQAAPWLAWAEEGVDWLGRAAAHEGLLAQLIEVLAAPQTAALGPLLAQQLRYSDAIDFDLEDVNGPVVGTLHTPARPGGPPSTFSRLLALVQAVAGKRMESAALSDPMPEYPEGGLFTVPDAGAFYVAALAGRAVFTLRLTEDDFFFPDQLEAAAEESPGRSELSAFTGIDGFTALQGAARPPGCGAYKDFLVSPQAAGRLLFALHDARVDPSSPFGVLRAGLQQVAPRLMTDDGVPVDEAFAGTLFAWEQGDFLQAVRPLAQAFVDHDAAHLLVEFMVLMHRHWPAMMAVDEHLELRLAAWLDEGAGLAAAGDMLRALGRPDGEQPAWSPSAWIAHALTEAIRPDASGQSLAHRLLAIARASMPAILPPGDGQSLPPWQVVHGADESLLWAAPQQVAALAHGAAFAARLALRDADAWATAWDPGSPMGAALERLSTAAPSRPSGTASALLAPRHLAAGRALAQAVAPALQDEGTLRAALGHAATLARALADLGAQGIAADGLDRHAALVRFVQALFTVSGPHGLTPAQNLAHAFGAVTAAQASAEPPRPRGCAQVQALADFLGDEEQGLPRFLALMAQRATP